MNKGVKFLKKLWCCVGGRVKQVKKLKRPTKAMFSTNLQIHIVTYCIHLHIHHTSRTPYLFHSFSDFVVYVVTTLIFPKNQRQCTSFSINVAILFLSFKRATTVPNKLIDSQHYKRLRRKTLTAFHSLLHFTLTTTRLIYHS